MLSGGIDMMVEVPPDNVATFSANSSYALHVQAGPASLVSDSECTRGTSTRQESPTSFELCDQQAGTC